MYTDAGLVNQMEDASLLSPEKEVYGTELMSSSTVTESCYLDIPDFSTTASMGDSEKTDATVSCI